jgi:hypothetical protein
MIPDKEFHKAEYFSVVNRIKSSSYFTNGKLILKKNFYIDYSL